jgi:tripartite-type tricarboxylate transporter receptor subunit TctC
MNLFLTTMGRPMKLLHSLCAAVLVLTLSGPAAAQTAAGRTVRIVVPFPPGGTADVLARTLGQQIAQTGGPTIVVENRPGGGTVIATEQVARAAPDGNTLLLMANSFVINASVRASLPYDPLTSFDPICLLVDSPQILVVNAASPFKTLGEFVAAAKAKPGEINYATVGPATTQHIGVEMFRRAAGINLTYVPYGGGAPAITALLGGHVMAVLANPSELMEQVNAGKLRAIAVASRERFSMLPNVPTIAESGYPGFEATAWFGLMVPAKTPKEAIAQHIAMFNAALAAPEVQNKLAAQGMRSVGICGEAFGAHVKQQFESYARVIKDANIKAD